MTYAFLDSFYGDDGYPSGDHESGGRGSDCSEIGCRREDVYHETDYHGNG
ncbi:hypothetical protein [Paenibacillus sp. GCM10028914]